MKEYKSREKRLSLDLRSIFGISLGDKVAIIGCGGKSSLMLALATESRKHSVLMTTTTHIFPPSANICDFVTDGEIKDVKSGVYLLYGGESGGKLSAPPLQKVLRMQSLFDYVFIEADGSKMRPLKGWADHEPVVPEFITTTIAVATVSPVGDRISEENTHRLSIFCKLTGAVSGETVTPAHIAAMISHPDGMLQKTAGRRVLYLNCIETEKDRNHAYEVFRQLPASVLQSLSRIVIGSLAQNTFEVIWPKL